jgi:hypothetical protein
MASTIIMKPAFREIDRSQGPIEICYYKTKLIKPCLVSCTISSTEAHRMQEIDDYWLLAQRAELVPTCAKGAVEPGLASCMHPRCLYCMHQARDNSASLLEPGCINRTTKQKHHMHLPSLHGCIGKKTNQAQLSTSNASSPIWCVVHKQEAARKLERYKWCYCVHKLHSSIISVPLLRLDTIRGLDPRIRASLIRLVCHLHGHHALV